MRNPDPSSDSDHAMGLYTADVASSEPLSREEERRLALLAREGDVEARNQLVSANLRFVISVAFQYQNQGLPIEDLIAHGNLGLIRAAEKFDPDLGNKFITYAVWWIRQAIQSALEKDTRTIRIPMNRAVLVNQARALLSKKYQANERRPAVSETADDLDVTEKFLTDSLIMANKPLSLDANVDQEDERYTLMDTVTGDDADSIEDGFEKKRLNEEIEEMLATLPEREEGVVRSYFGFGGEENTLEGIGRDLGVSRERARQIKESAIRKLRQRAGRGRARALAEELA